MDNLITALFEFREDQSGVDSKSREFKLVWLTSGQSDEQTNKQSDECTSWAAVAAKNY